MHTIFMQVKKDFVRIPSDSIEYFVPKHVLEGPTLSGASIKLAGYSKLTKGYYISRPSHRGFHVLFATLSGSGKFILEDDREIIMKPNDTFFSHTDGMGHIILQQSSKETWEVCWFHINADSTWFLPPCHDYAVYTWRNIEKLKTCILGIADEENRPDTNSVQIQELYAQLLLSYVQRELDNKTHYRNLYNEIAMEKLWNQVASSLWKVWTLDELADSMALSKAHFCRLCNEYYHISPGKKVKQMKLESALFLLQNTQNTISNIASLCGYNTQASFSAAFSQYYGLSPRKARAKEFPLSRNQKEGEYELETQQHILGTNALSQAVPLFRSTWEEIYTPLLIADENTWNAAGSRIKTDFEAVHIPVQQVVFPATPLPQADEKTISRIRVLLQGNDFVAIAIGSGTVNDIVKRASKICNKPYMLVATSPSNDGYTSSSAMVITNRGYQTIICHAPYSVIADSTVLCAAPIQAIASGAATLASQLCVGADWIVADVLGIQPMKPNLWERLQIPIRKVLASPKVLVKRNKNKIGEMFGCLMNIGFVGQSMHDPFLLQGEAQFMAAIWEQAGRQKERIPHGSLIALGTLVVIAFLEHLTQLTLDDIATKLPSEKIPVSWKERDISVSSVLGKLAVPSVFENCRNKFLSPEEQQKRQVKILEKWDEIITALRRQIIPFQDLKARFLLLGCPTQPKDIGLGKNQVKTALLGAQMICSHYTLFDMVYELGLLDTMVRELFEGSWFTEYAD